MNPIAIGLALAALAAPAWAIHKCVGPDGRAVFQDAPCADGRGQRIEVRPASGHAPLRAPETAAAAPAIPAPAAAPPPPAAPTGAPVMDALTRDAETCFRWYAGTLANPRDAYYSRPARDKRVVRITMHATNRYGGIVTQEARCEIVNGKLDEGWTKIHAERVKW